NDACDPLSTDTDLDGICDAQEIVDGTDPNDPCDPNSCDAVLSARMILGGVYDESSGLMRDDLRSKGVIPANQPYNSLTDFGYMGTESVDPTIFNVTGADAIVDWVFVELRDQTDPSVILFQRAGLLQRDGDVVDLDGVSPLAFAGAGKASYYISVKHRNHLGVMTDVPVTFGINPVPVDFTSTATGNYQLSGPTGSAFAQEDRPDGKRALWAGNMSAQPSAPDPHTGDRIIYQGPAAEQEEAYFEVLLNGGNVDFLPLFVVEPVYSRSDANMDGMVIYQGSNSDSDVPFFTVFLFPGNTGFSPIFTVYEQIPK
ncbi:MAG TPA: thrombospondin type 3 repeat-containing protein, partial [Flavilitoribacter sp.]|nr:thrombospondin type 3 repeat-containing protein [Flavilitoribacter sp.]